MVGEAVIEERWLPVVGWEGHEVSDHGRVRSLDRVVTFPDGRSRRAKGCILKPQKRSGYYVVQVGRKTQYVHDLVLEAFDGPKPMGECVRHGPLGHLNNSLTNLCYGTRSENGYDSSLRDLTHPQSHKTACPEGHPYDGKRTRPCGSTYRYCKRCKNKKERERYARLRLAS